MTHHRSNHARAVGVVGAGRLGTALATALRGAGVEVHGPVGRGEVPRGDVLLLCVPDAEIPAAAQTASGAAPFVGHTSGATPLTALAPAERTGAAVFGLHPLQTVPDGAEPSIFEGAGCAVAGSTEQARAVAQDLALRVGMRPFTIDDEARAAYHAAASIASNFLVAVQAAAEEVAAGAGLQTAEARSLLAPLVRQTVDNILELGPAQALTGPIARGDEQTVARQREAVDEVAPELLPLFDALEVATRRLAQGVPA